MNAIVSWLNDLFGTVRPADAVDILVVSAILYVLISWLRRSESRGAPRRVVVLALGFLVVYFLARTFDLFLLESLLRALSVVLLVAAVIVFQSDLRRLLDRLGAWGRSRGAVLPATRRTVTILTEVAARMSESRTGALIAIRGAETWESHIQGGIELDGVVSAPLLYSIFSPDTPGHDGAVLIEGERISKFGAHLPLSGRTPDVSSAGGTRHAAGLGLSEESDALVVVVSEESGTISVAEKGVLVPLRSPTELAERLSTFWQTHYRAKRSADRPWWRRGDPATAGLALSLAVIAWLVFAYSPGRVQRTFEVPIAYRNVPPEWMLEEDTIPTARVTLVGREHSFTFLNAERLVISLDLSDPEPGRNEFLIEASDLALPTGLRLDDVEPRRVTVVARRLARVDLPVRVRTAGPLPDSIRLVPDPPTVTVLVPEEDRAPEAIPTDVVDLSRATETPIPAMLDLPGEVRLLPTEPAEVLLRVERVPGQGIGVEPTLMP